MKRILKVSAVAAALLAGTGGLAVAFPGHGHGGPGWGGQGRSGHFMGRHIDGTVAFLKTELKITEQQEPQWQAFEAALRAATERKRGPEHRNAERPKAERDKAERPNAVERLARMEQRATRRAETVHNLRVAFEPLYASMSDEQKKTADNLMRRGRH